MRSTILFLNLAFSLTAGPLWFEPNQGQSHPAVQFLAHTPDGFAYFGRAQMAIGDVRLQLTGANLRVEAELEDPIPGIVSYFIGRSEKDWHTGVPRYGRIRYRNVYKGIDLVYYGNSRDLEYDFILQPGADPAQIRLAYNKPVQTTADGDLLIGDLRQKRPKVYQDGREIACDYLVRDHTQVTLALASYDHSRPLTIDPTLVYSTLLGGPGYEVGTGIRVDSKGSAYVCMFERSPSGPSINPFQQVSGLSYAAFVVKLAPDGKSIVFYAYVGGTDDTYAFGIAIDVAGNSYLTGLTRSVDFPIKNAPQTIYGGGNEDAYVAKISPDGRTLLYATYIGGINDDWGQAITVDSQGAAYVAGYTYSFDFPTQHPLQANFGGGSDAFITKLSPDGRTFIFSTFLGGSGLDEAHGIDLDSSGSIYVGGSTASDDFPVKNGYQMIHGSTFVTKLTPSGDAIVYSTFLGAKGSAAHSLQVDPSGSVYVCGETGDGFQTKNAFQSTYEGGQTDIFVARLNPSGSDLVFATYLGGSAADYDSNSTLALDSNGNVYVTGSTYSSDFPVKNSMQPFIGAIIGFKADAFVAGFSPAGQLIFSTYIGGAGSDGGNGIAAGQDGAIYVTGQTTSDDFPLKNSFQSVNNGGSGDAFILKLAPDAAPPPPFTATPGTLPFRYIVGGLTPASQTVALGGAVAYSATTTGVSWLSVSPASGTAPATLTVSVDPSALTPANYSGTVRITQPGAANSPLDIPVTLNVLAAAPVLTAINPNVVPLNSDDTTFTVTGSGFTPQSSITFNGSTAYPTTYIDAQTLQFTMVADSFTDSTTLTVWVIAPQTAPSNTLTLTIGTPSPIISAVANAATLASGPVAPGEIVMITGTALTDQVTFDGVAVTPSYVSPTQVNVTVPYSAAAPTTTLQIGASTPVKLAVAPSSPGIFTAIQIDAQTLVLIATGCGSLTNDDPPQVALPVAVTVNGETAAVLSTGIAPGQIEGTNQITIQLPDDITSGALSVILTVGDASSPPFTFTLAPPDTNSNPAVRRTRVTRPVVP